MNDLRDRGIGSLCLASPAPLHMPITIGHSCAMTQQTPSAISPRPHSSALSSNAWVSRRRNGARRRLPRAQRRLSGAKPQASVGSERLRLGSSVEAGVWRCWVAPAHSCSLGNNYTLSQVPNPLPDLQPPSFCQTVESARHLSSPHFAHPASDGDAHGK
jgi:hypothetical protein